MTEQTHCVGMTNQGQPCRRARTRGKDYCSWHDPIRAEERRTGVRPAPEPLQPLVEGPVSLDSPEEVVNLLASVASRLATDPDSDTARAYSLSTVAGVLLRAIRLRDLVQEIDRLQAENQELTRGQGELNRQLTYARQDLERSRRAMAELRDQQRSLATHRAE